MASEELEKIIRSNHISVCDYAKLLIKKKTVLQDEWYIDNNILTQGAEGAICQPPDERKEAGAYGYIFGFNPICDYALRRDHSCCLYHTQKIAPSVW